MENIRNFLQNISKEDYKFFPENSSPIQSSDEPNSQYKESNTSFIDTKVTRFYIKDKDKFIKHPYEQNNDMYYNLNNNKNHFINESNKISKKTNI